MLETLQRALAIPELRRRLQVVVTMFVIYAIGAHIPLPGIDHTKLAQIMGSGAGNLLGLVDVFSGGALRRMSLFAMGINPYINASIIMQMLGYGLPALEQLQKEGESGRKKIAKYTRYLSVVLGFVQACGMVFIFTRNGVNIAPLQFTQIVFTLVAASTFLLWLGEQVSEHGVGNGVSLIIFTGIMLSIPYQTQLVGKQLAAGTVSWISVVGLILMFIGTVFAIVYISEGTRRIPVHHAKRVIGMRQTQAGSSYLPIKVNSAGVIPIIFAISLMLIPATIANFLPGQPGVGTWGSMKDFLNNMTPGGSWRWLGINVQGPTAIYALLVIAFTYFYTAVVMNVQDMSDNLKKYGNYIPGIRPGKPTYEYLDRVVSRITLAGALFLAAVAVIQYIVPLGPITRQFSIIGGTSLLIVVGVAIETMQAIEAQMLMRNYEGFIKSASR